MMHEDQLDVAPGTVRRLVDEQFPSWRGLPVRSFPSAGTVNAIFRIGDDLAARFPLRAEDPARAGDWLAAEATAACELAVVSTVPTPEPVAIGEPGHGYPLPWSVQTWLPGRVATEEDPSGSTAFATDLAGFITGLRAADPRGRRFASEGRGGDLREQDAWMEVCFRESDGLLDVPRLRAMWAKLRTLPTADADVMSHRDLTPSNVLVGQGRLVGVLDGGSFAAADPALDLVGAWHLLDGERRKVVRDALGCSTSQWRRGMAWAFAQSMGLVWYYARSNPTMSSWGRRTLDRLIGDGAE
jgi:aminoglycoside phosphotransferase (APT) family kinase protein